MFLCKNLKLRLRNNGNWKEQSREHSALRMNSAKHFRCSLSICFFFLSFIHSFGTNLCAKSSHAFLITCLFCKLNWWEHWTVRFPALVFFGWNERQRGGWPCGWNGTGTTMHELRCGRWYIWTHTRTQTKPPIRSALHSAWSFLWFDNGMSDRALDDFDLLLWIVEEEKEEMLMAMD